MAGIDALFAVVCVVVAIAGAAKIADPAATARTLETLKVPVPRLTTRLLGSAELAAGGLGLVLGGPAVAVAVAVLHLGFAGFVLLVRRRSDVTSCGCFGVTAAPPSLVHVTVNVASAGVAFAAASGGARPIADLMDGAPFAGVPLLIGVALAAGLVVVLDTLLPELLDATATVRSDTRAAAEGPRTRRRGTA